MTTAPHQTSSPLAGNNAGEDSPRPSLPAAVINSEGESPNKSHLPTPTINAGEDNSNQHIPLGNIPEQAASSVPSQLPPHGLPQPARDSISEMAKLGDHVAWLLSGNEFNFLPTETGNQSSNEPPLTHAEQAQDLAELTGNTATHWPEAAVEHIGDVGATLPNGHADWLIS
jgi:hypothetical protein